MIGRAKSHLVIVSAVSALALAACSGGAGTYNGSQATQQQADTVMPQAGGAQVQTIGTQAMHIEAPAPPAVYQPQSLHAANAPLLTKPIIDDVGSFAGGPIIEGENTGSNGTGVEGISTASGNGVVGVTDGSGNAVYGNGGSAGGIGVYGFSKANFGVVGNSTNFVGVIGETSAAAQYGGEFTNSATSGNALLAKSATGNGIIASTAFLSGITSTPLAKAGVLGQDLSTDNGEEDAGVAGTTNTGYGVFGEANGNGQGAGVEGLGNNRSVGVVGAVPFGAAHGGSVGVDASNEGSNTGLFGNGDGLSAFSLNADAIVAEGEATGTTPVMLMFTDSGGPFIIGKNGNNASQSFFSIDGSGNMILAGNLTVDGSISDNGGTIGNCSSCPAPLISSRNGHAQIENVGEAQMVNGRATVSIDATFASRLDPAQRYHVFITPEGENNGLYVTAKTSGSFSVREVHSGHSTLSFDYRIVGQPRATTLAKPIWTPNRPPRRVRGMIKM